MIPQNACFEVSQVYTIIVVNESNVQEEPMKIIFLLIPLFLLVSCGTTRVIEIREQQVVVTPAITAPVVVDPMVNDTVIIQQSTTETVYP